MIKRLISELIVWLGFYHVVWSYYDCIEKQKYLTISIRKYPLGAKLELGNSINKISEWGNECGVIISCGNPCGYIKFKYGYIIFKQGALNDSHFGYAIWHSKKEVSRKEVSTFCSYPPYSEQNLKDIIKLLKHGRQ